MKPRAVAAVETGSPTRAEMLDSVCDPRTLCNVSALIALLEEPLSQLETVSERPARRNFSRKPPRPPLCSWINPSMEPSNEVALLPLRPNLLSTSLTRRSIAPIEEFSFLKTRICRGRRSFVENWGLEFQDASWLGKCSCQRLLREKS